MSESGFTERLRLRVEEEQRDTCATLKTIAMRMNANQGTIAAWLKGGRPMPKYFTALARFIRVTPAQMQAWFPEEERRRSFTRSKI